LFHHRRRRFTIQKAINRPLKNKKYLFLMSYIRPVAAMQNHPYNLTSLIDALEAPGNGLPAGQATQKLAQGTVHSSPVPA
jgi:hypothetical protein